MSVLSSNLAATAALAGLAFLIGCSSTHDAGSSASLTQVPASVRTAFVDTRGDSHDVDALLASGRQVAFVFWQPWCGSCQAEAPIASRAARAFASQMEVIGVVSGPEGEVDEEALSEALYGWDMAYSTIRDKDMTLTRAFGVDGVPMIVVVNPDGQVAYRSHAAPKEW